MFYHNLFIIIYILYRLAHHEAVLFTTEKHILFQREG